MILLALLVCVVAIFAVANSEWPAHSYGTHDVPIYDDSDPRSEYFPADPSIDEWSDIQEDNESRRLRRWEGMDPE